MSTGRLDMLTRMLDRQSEAGEHRYAVGLIALGQRVVAELAAHVEQAELQDQSDARCQIQAAVALRDVCAAETGRGALERRAADAERRPQHDRPELRVVAEIQA